jgi:hypothetical protein
MGSGMNRDFAEMLDALSAAAGAGRYPHIDHRGDKSALGRPRDLADIDDLHRD